MTTVAPAAQSILDQATALWPNRSRVSDGTIGDPAHASRTSDHNPDSRGIVHAADLTHDPANGCDAHAHADKIRKRAQAGKEPRLKYVISNRRIASETAEWSWRAYTGSNPHDHHAHFSVNSDSTENSTAPWFTDNDLTEAQVKELTEAIKQLGVTLTGVIQRQGDKTRNTVQRQAILTRLAIYSANGDEQGIETAKAELKNLGDD